MYEQTIEDASCYYIDKKVTPEDVLYVFRCIENMNYIAKEEKELKELKELEKKLLINTFNSNKILFKSRVYYSNFSNLIIKMGYYYDTKKVEQTYKIMNAIQEIIFNIDEIEIKEKYQILNTICNQYEVLYHEFIRDKQNMKKNFFSIFKNIYPNYDIYNIFEKQKKYQYKIS